MCFTLISYSQNLQSIFYYIFAHQIDLGLLLAKREITSHWKSKQSPSFHRSHTEFRKWADCEGIIRLQLATRAHSEKTLEMARAWEALVVLLKAPEEDLDTSSNDSDTVAPS